MAVAASGPHKWGVRIIGGNCQGLGRLGVSHRWETPDEPDTKGAQLAAIKRYLTDHPEVEYVWFDFTCMPQKPRTPEEEDEFVKMLSNVNGIFAFLNVMF